MAQEQFLIVNKEFRQGDRGEKKESCSKLKPNRIILTTSFMLLTFFKKEKKKAWSGKNIFVLELRVRKPGFQS